MGDILHFNKNTKHNVIRHKIDSENWVGNVEIKNILMSRLLTPIAGNRRVLDEVTSSFSLYHSEPYNSRLDNYNAQKLPFPLMQTVDLNVREIGLACDPFMFMDRKYRTTFEFLQQTTGVIIHTMSDLCIYDDYLQVIKNNRHKIVIYSHFEKHTDIVKTMQPSSPSLRRRNKAYRVLIDNGVAAEYRFIDMELLKMSYITATQKEGVL